MNAPAVPAIEFRELSLRYGALEALRGLSLEVRQGEIFGLLGPNGAGKTSALECLLGLRQPDGGTLRLLGRELQEGGAAARSLVGAQLQDASLQDALSPLEALRLFAAFHPRPVDARQLLERFGLTDKARTRFRELSEGQKRRLFLALAVINDPQVLVLDEPSAGLDPRSREDLHQLIRGLRESGRTVLLSTHLLDEAEQLCDRIAILDAGRLVALDRPAALIARSRALPRLTLRCLRPPGPGLLACLPGIRILNTEGALAELETADPGTVLAALTRLLDSEHNALLDLHIRRPSLADVFLELTGSSFAEGDGRHAEKNGRRSCEAARKGGNTES